MLRLPLMSPCVPRVSGVTPVVSGHYISSCVLRAPDQWTVCRDHMTSPALRSVIYCRHALQIPNPEMRIKRVGKHNLVWEYNKQIMDSYYSEYQRQSFYFQDPARYAGITHMSVTQLVNHLAIFQSFPCIQIMILTESRAWRRGRSPWWPTTWQWPTSGWSFQSFSLVTWETERNIVKLLGLLKTITITWPRKLTVFSHGPPTTTTR